MSADVSSAQTRVESALTTSARQQLLDSIRDKEYRHLFVAERLRASVALQIRALRQQRVMTQTRLGQEIGMAQTWVSKLEDPEYGKMTVATLLRLAEAFDTDLEIKFRPFSSLLRDLPTQDTNYFMVLSFADEFETEQATPSDSALVEAVRKPWRTRDDDPHSASDAKSHDQDRQGKGLVLPRWSQASQGCDTPSLPAINPEILTAHQTHQQYGTPQGSGS
ncbi:MAG: helix-turn-helix domain-containing protein [Bryobacteraceae bacterium]